MTKAHAKFSPSASERWLNCPASIEMSKDMPSTTSKEALEGIQAHELVNRALKTRLAKKIAPGSKDWMLNIDKVPSNYSREMAKDCADFIEWLGPILATCEEWYTEKEVSLIPSKVFGTADVIGISARRVVIIDFKYGIFTYVPAFNNPQIGIYGLSAAWDLGVAKDFDFTIEGYIYQPRNEHFIEPERYDMGPEQITALFNAVKMAVYASEQGNTEPRAGEWCHWCKAIGKCPAHLKNLKVVTDSKGSLKDPATLTVDELAFVIACKPQMKKFFEAIDARIIDLARHGVEVPGVKVVESFGHRKWQDDNAMLVFDELRKEVVLSPAQTEEKLGRKEYEEKYSQFLLPSVVRPAVAKANSKKKKYDFAEHAFSGFIDETNNNNNSED